jgi:beta-glucosidase
MGVLEGGSRAFMASYNLMNGADDDQSGAGECDASNGGQDGIICTDAGAMRNLVTSQKYATDFDQAAAACVKAGIGQFLDNYRDAVHGALKRSMLSEADIDRALTGNFRVMIKLGLLDPPSLVPYSTIGQEPDDPWQTEKHKAVARLATQKSIVLLKNQQHCCH